MGQRQYIDNDKKKQQRKFNTRDIEIILQAAWDHLSRQQEKITGEKLVHIEKTFQEEEKKFINRFSSLAIDLFESELPQGLQELAGEFSHCINYKESVQEAPSPVTHYTSSAGSTTVKEALESPLAAKTVLPPQTREIELVSVNPWPRDELRPALLALDDSYHWHKVVGKFSRMANREKNAVTGSCDALDNDDPANGINSPADILRKNNDNDATEWGGKHDRDWAFDTIIVPALKTMKIGRTTYREYADFFLKWHNARSAEKKTDEEFRQDEKLTDQRFRTLKSKTFNAIRHVLMEIFVKNYAAFTETNRDSPDKECRTFFCLLLEKGFRARSGIQAMAKKIKGMPKDAIEEMLKNCCRLVMDRIIARGKNDLSW